MTKSTILKVSGLKVYFPIVSGFFRSKVGEVRAVDGIDFSIFEEEVLGLVGESGSGKSTTGRAAIRLIEPTAGEIRFLNEDVLSFSGKRMKRFRTEVQMIFQDPYASLNPRKTLGDSVEEPLRYYRMVEEGILGDYAAAIFKDVGLSPDLMGRYPHEISGGQQQRVCIGRAIALKPKLLICDEAVSALDVSVQAQILNLLMRLKEEHGLSYLFISHDLSVVRHIADRIAVMNLGKIVEADQSEKIFNDPKNDYTIQLLKAIPSITPR
jgi:ABC-type oligopeptide transport system ATPase subunit